MKKIIYLLLISHLTFAQKAILDTNTINIGEQTTLRISNELHNTKSWPSYEKFIVEGVEIIERSKLDTINGIISQLFIITAWDSGSYYIPVIEFSENNKTRGNILNVQSLNLEENAQLKVFHCSLRWCTASGMCFKPPMCAGTLLTNID